MERERRDILRRLMKAMRHDVGREPLLVRSDGVRPVVVCLPTDTVWYATQRVAGHRGLATVVVPHRDGLVPIRWELHAGQNSASDEAVEAVHPDSSMQMLLELLAVCGEGGVSLRISTELGDVALVEEPAVSIPA